LNKYGIKYKSDLTRGNVYSQLKAELSEIAKYDLVRQQLSTMISPEALNTFTQTFMTTEVKNMLKD